MAAERTGRGAAIPEVSFMTAVPVPEVSFMAAVPEVSSMAVAKRIAL